MKKTAFALTLTLIYALAALFGSGPAAARAQTRNQTSKFELAEAFTFPNECTGELMDVTDTTVVVCHDQERADGTFAEKCQADQFVTAVGETTGITFHGTATFKDEFTATDHCNFTFTNDGAVRLISQGSDVNLILHFDDVTVMKDCVLTTDTHMASADCRGSKK
jgi:hypothetical protein